MILREYGSELYPNARAVVGDALGSIDADILSAQPVAVFGGAARSALFETILGVMPTIRDIDLAGIGQSASREKLQLASVALTPEDAARNEVRIYDSVEALLRDTDFTMNQAALLINNLDMPLQTTNDAPADVRSKVIRVTESRAAKARRMSEAENEKTQKQFLRDRTNMPARAAYFAAVLRAEGLDFAVEMGDHPRPSGPEETHTFFLGLAVRKALQVDEAVRGAGDVTATTILIEEFAALSLTKTPKPRNVEDVVAFCEFVNQEHPHLLFSGSKVASMVTHAAAPTS